MVTDKLYKLAFEFKKTKLWRKLFDTELFAVNLSGNRTGYISIMGALGDYCALGLYIGEDGLNSYRSILSDDCDYMTEFEEKESMLRQNCLQCALVCKNQLSEEEYQEVKKYALCNNIKFCGKNAYPQFIKYKPYYYPWDLQTEQEQDDLCEALTAAIELDKMLNNKSSYDLGFLIIDKNTKYIPLINKKDGIYILDRCEIPTYLPEKYPRPNLINDIYIEKLKKTKKAGVWECELICLPKPIKNNPEDIPRFPIVLIAVDTFSNYVLSVPSVKNYQDDPEELLNLFMEDLISQGFCPKQINVRDNRTYEFAEEFCNRLNIEIDIKDRLPLLTDVENELLIDLEMDEKYNDNTIMMMLDSMLQMDEADMEDIPDEAFDSLEMCLADGTVPEVYREKVTELIQFRKNFKSKKAKKRISNKSCVISVSLEAGCYRHIMISDDSTLFELHKAILDAFDFEDDHAHAFFMDNCAWSNNNCYYSEGIERHYKITKKYSLDKIGLSIGQKFKYIFDFGDEWTFNCKLLRIVDKKTPAPVVVKEQGEAPEQYGVWGN